VEIKVYKGTVIFSGVHLEYSPTRINLNDPFLQPLYDDLQKGDSLRIAILIHLLDRLKIFKAEKGGLNPA